MALENLPFASFTYLLPPDEQAEIADYCERYANGEFKNAELKAKDNASLDISGVSVGF